MRWLLASVALFAFVGQALAEVIPLRSGEHAEFSRLVLDLPSGVDWQIETTDGEPTLVFSDALLSFDATRVFDFIPRTRLRSVTTDTGRITLSLACDCPVDTQLLPPNKLVIDIGDPSQDHGDDQTVTLLADSGNIAVPNRHLDMPLTPGAISDGPGVPLPSTESLHLSEALRELLVQELGRASVQGLVTAPTPNHPASEPTPLPDPPAAPGIASETAPPTIGVALETSVDRADPGAAPAPVTDVGLKCFSDHLFDFSAWFDAGDPTANLSAARRALMGEFDRVEARDVEQLIQAQLALGMGVEADQTIRTYGQELTSAAVYQALAAIIDNQPGALANPLLGQESCDGRVALWAVLSAPDQMQTRHVATGALAAAFSELPQHMRIQHITPLTDVFIARDEIEVAKQLQNALSRTTSQPTETMRLSQAQTDIALGRSDQGEEALRELSYATGNLASDSHLNLLDRYLDQGKAVPEPDLLAAEAYAIQLRGTEAGRQAARIAVIGYARAGRFADALRVSQNTAIDTASLNELAISASRSAPPVEFLTNVQKLLLPPLAEKLNDAARLTIADRFAQLGFLERSEQVLSQVSRAEAAEVALARARLALSSHAPTEALRIINHFQLQGAELLQAQAYEMMHEYRDAARYYSLTGDLVATQRMAWMSSDWGAAASPDDARFGPFLAHAMTPDQPAQGRLERAQATLEQGSRALLAVEALIAEQN
ncbi:hypothetical protein [Actibacterium sp. XHP0104]|uniref:hypothetical protein n=1 Tax=Actibacterium sp. XHP0104 TaxID=2984335 RepID=UPI0021E7F72D|nr:hypothetical protein [Actibacterium sp. XHP0104]MCV2881813.1 hypothetical protein [Actibacterium sp. XHP0104]